MTIEIMPGGTITYFWATVRAFVKDYVAGRYVFVRFVEGINPTETSPWTNPVQMNTKLYDFGGKTYAKSWFHLTPLKASTVYTYEVFSYDAASNKVSTSGMFTTIKKPNIPVSEQIPNLEFLQGRYLIYENVRYLFANDCYLYKLNAGLISNMTGTPLQISKGIFDELKPAIDLNNDPHLFKIDSGGITRYYFEFNKDIINPNLNLSYRKAAEIDVNAVNAGKPDNPFNLTAAPALPATALPDVDTGESALKYAK